MSRLEFSFEKEIECADITITFKISYSVIGQYRPATMWEPGEDLELDEIKVTAKSYFDKKNVLIQQEDAKNFQQYWNIDYSSDDMEVLCWEDFESKSKEARDKE
jgi:hypothetical protein